MGGAVIGDAVRRDRADRVDLGDGESVRAVAAGVGGVTGPGVAGRNCAGIDVRRECELAGRHVDRGHPGGGHGGGAGGLSRAGVHDALRRAGHGRDRGNLANRIGDRVGGVVVVAGGVGERPAVGGVGARIDVRGAGQVQPAAEILALGAGAGAGCGMAGAVIGDVVRRDRAGSAGPGDRERPGTAASCVVGVTGPVCIGARGAGVGVVGVGDG